MASPRHRAPKRPSSTSEADSDEDGPRAKKAPGEPDFSGIVRTKLHQYTRTGQACDRCKVRKIRCDALPEGCSHCLNQSLECYVTDRVTGRTERRGYLQQLEREKTDMLAHIRELEKLLQTKHVEVHPWQWSPFAPNVPPDVSTHNGVNLGQDAESKARWSKAGSVWFKERPQASTATQFAQPLVIRTRSTGSFLGFDSDSALLSSISGTVLSILGTTIDLTSFASPDDEDPLPNSIPGSPIYNKSAVSFFQSVANINPRLENIELPSKQDAITYSEWYFLMINPFVPMLHKPTFMKLLAQIYDDPANKPTVSELVIVHMMFANIYDQYGMRNRQDPEKYVQLKELSNKHYHWSLSRVCEVGNSSTLTAIQALCMISQYTRSFPKPGCSFTITAFAFHKAIELNLHRAVKRPGNGTTLEIEMRKRVWWSVYALQVTINGRLGRPMPLALQDFDVDFPLDIPDECITDEGIVDPSRLGQSSFAVGLRGFQISPLYAQLYSSLCCAKRDPSRYISVVRDLEEQFRRFEESLPDDLNVDKCKTPTQVYALYTAAFTIEFELLLRHPSLSMTRDPKFCAENTRLSEQAAAKLLKVVRNIYRLKCLDTTWYQMFVYVGAMFTTLAAHWERRFRTTASELATLREDMTTWLDIISEILSLSACGPQLRNDLGGIVERTIAWIEQDINREEAKPLPFPASRQQQSVTPHDPRNGQVNGNAVVYDSAAGNMEATYQPSVPYGVHPEPATTANGSDGTGAFASPDRSLQYLYVAPQNSSVVQNTAAVSGAESIPDRVDAANNPLVAFATRATQQVANPAHQSSSGEDWHMEMEGHTGGNMFHDWAAAMADPNSMERYTVPGGPILPLGSAGERTHLADHASAVTGSNNASAAVGMESVGAGNMEADVNSHAGQWPLLVFNGGPAT